MDVRHPDVVFHVQIGLIPTAIGTFELTVIIIFNRCFGKLVARCSLFVPLLLTESVQHLLGRFTSSSVDYLGLKDG